ncbi:hypothetical protein K502DRAFT_309324 [Neoconidiobolus thromboides FSU 785]|nr:hypothetical protein K502DRAFT_309324 [Neoconidiobolus thromboides FSU 785]
MLTLYNLINKEGGVYYSPYGWRVLLALKHKDVEFDHIGLTYSKIIRNIPEITKGEWDKIPLLVYEDGTYNYESSKIVKNLELKYPNNSLFPNGSHFSDFIENYITSYFQPLYKVIILDIYNQLGNDNDKAYFRDSRENVLNMTLEQFSSTFEECSLTIDKFLSPFLTTLKNKTFLEGENVTYSDYVLYSHLKLVQLVSKNVFGKIVSNEKNQVVKNWFDSIEALNDNFAKLLC